MTQETKARTIYFGLVALGHLAIALYVWHRFF
jgi:hypothetical protein